MKTLASKTKPTPDQREELILKILSNLSATDISSALIDARSERDELAEAMRELLVAYDSILPGVRYIVIQNYAILNAAPIAARAALAKVKS